MQARPLLSYLCYAVGVLLSALVIHAVPYTQSSGDEEVAEMLAFGLDEIGECLRNEDMEGATWHLQELVQIQTERERITTEELTHLYALESVAASLYLTELQLPLRRRIYEGELHFHAPDHPRVADAAHGLAVALYLGGRPAEAKEHFEAYLPERSDESVARVLRRTRTLVNIAACQIDMGQLQAALETALQAVEERSAVLPPEDLDVLGAQHTLADIYLAMGRLEEADLLFTRILKIRERVLPPDDPEIFEAKTSVSTVRREQGRLDESLRLDEEVLAYYQAHRPDEHFDVLDARHNLAITRAMLGDLPVAKVLFESLVRARARALGNEHPALVEAKQNLALINKQLGDLEGALVLEREVLKIREENLEPGHLDIIKARANLSTTLAEMGRLEEALEMDRAVLASWEAKVEATNSNLLGARGNLAVTLMELERFEEAKVLLEQTLKGARGNLPEWHPLLLNQVASLGWVAYGLGDIEGAKKQWTEALAGRLQVLPLDHPDVLDTRAALALSHHVLGEENQAKALLAAQASGIRSRLLYALSLSPREARAMADAERSRLGQFLYLAGSEFTVEMFSLVETLRHVVSTGGELSAVAPELLSASDTLRRELAALSQAERAPGWREEFEGKVLERDRILAEIRRQKTNDPALAQPIEAKALASHLDKGSLAVGFFRHPGWSWSPEELQLASSADQLCALLVDSKGEVARLELGTVQSLRELALTWLPRVDGNRGGSAIAPLESSGAPQIQAGRALRRALLDPLLEHVQERDARIHLCPDDFLHLIPFDALPLDEEGLVVGDRWNVRMEVSFANLIRVPSTSQGRDLVLVGDLDFGSSGAKQAGVAWKALPATRNELERIARVHERAFGEPARRLTGESATKEALRSSVYGMPFVHIATHGWFRSPPEPPSQDHAPSLVSSGPGGSVEGMAPMTLCGLCLSGANQGRDELGTLPGLLTAEELSGYDLRQCELAVLSACETNVGIRRAGQGIFSLQRALHAAGARATLTSLWRVNDAWTEELMVAFYQGMWDEGMGIAEALWEGKMELRRQGKPFEAWAGWILTGARD